MLNWKKFVDLLLVTFLVAVSSAAFFPESAYASTSKYSISTFTGIYSPHLDMMNFVLSENRLAILQDANYLLPRNENFFSEQRNMVMDPIKGRALYGVTGEYKLNDRYSVYASISAWEGTSVGRDRIWMFTRSNVEPTFVPRQSRYSILVNDIMLGWKYKVFYKEDVADIYFDLGLLGMSNVNFTMDALVQVVTPELSFASMSSTEAKGRSFYMKVGSGGDYYITKWWSLGASINYIISTMIKMKTTRRFLAGYPDIPAPPPESDPPLDIPVPQIIPSFGDEVGFSEVSTVGGIERQTGFAPLALELDGFEFLLSFKFHF